MLDIKGDIEKKKAEKESKKAVEPAEEKKPNADEKLKEDFNKVKEVVTKVTSPVKTVWHFIPDSAKGILALGGGATAAIVNKAQELKNKVTDKK